MSSLTAPAQQAGAANSAVLPRGLCRDAFDQAILKIERERGTQQFDNAFHRLVADAVFDACWEALEHFAEHNEQRGYPEPASQSELRAVIGGKIGNTVPPRLHVVSAPMGTGKTTFTIAFIMALVELGKRIPQMPQGCVYLTDQIVKADEMYRQLNHFLPGRVAIWTSDHDPDCAEPKKVLKPAARFHKDDLKAYPVAIATHALFKTVSADQVRIFLRDGQPAYRALTLVDEQMDDVTVFETSLAQTAKVIELLREQKADELIPHLGLLLQFMTPKTVRGGRLEKPKDDPTSWGVVKELAWFDTPEASWFAQSYKHAVPGLDAIFGFARAMVHDYAFMVSGPSGPRFIGYEPKHRIVPGMVLLDATSDLDGVTRLCPWRVHKDVPRVRYDRLSVIHVEPCTQERLNEYFRVDENRAAYVEWMKQVIQKHMQPHERGLVVCKKILIERGNIPDFSNIEPPTYPWNVEGRYVAITYWGGPGIGSNDWKDADVVFLFDEYFIPKGAAIGRTQGLVLAPTSSGPIASMSTSNTTSEEVSWIDEGHLLRWTKQMAMRGRARHFDHQGICGEQKLVLTGDYERLLLNWSLLFPGAKLSAVRQNRNLSAYSSRRRQLIEIFSDPELPIRVPTADIGERLGVKWKDVASSLIDDDMKAMLMTLGWTYVSRKGAGGAYFERIGATNDQKQKAEVL